MAAPRDLWTWGAVVPQEVAFPGSVCSELAAVAGWHVAMPATEHYLGTMSPTSRQSRVFTLVVEVGRNAGDGLPKGATGAALLCYAAGHDEAEAVRETVAVLKKADLAPLDVTGYGDVEERRSAGIETDAEELALMDRAAAENSVIVAQVTPFFADEDNQAARDR